MRLKDKVAIVTGSGRGIGEGVVYRWSGFLGQGTGIDKWEDALG